MTTSRILTIPNDSILRTISKPTTLNEIKKLNLIYKIKTAIKESLIEGCGLSAVQIGIPVRFACIFIDNKEELLINPEIIIGRGKVIKNEGCLSIPNKYVNVQRFVEIEYISNGKKKRANGFKANVIQHEIDHMNGILIVDKEYINENLDKQ